MMSSVPASNQSTSTPPSLDVYREYIAHELKGKDLARISCIYMRALADHCLDVELWKEYLKYLVRVGEGGVRGGGWDEGGEGGVE